MVLPILEILNGISDNRGMDKIFPDKLKEGNEVRVVAPARSLGIISQEIREIANKRFEEMGLRLSFSKHAEEMDDARSSSIESRVSDLHEAFSDQAVKMILCVIGGFNSNQLLPYLDYELIKANPKILCGYSDITAPTNAIYAKTGLVTYSGPHYSTFGQKKHFDYTLEYFKKCLFENAPFSVEAPEYWSNDAWYKDQENRNLIKNDGYLIINEGSANGTIVGGNLCTLNLLHGTEFMPSLENSILFLEDDETTNRVTFDRDLESITQLPQFSGVKGIVIGRFEQKSEVSRDDIVAIIKNKRALDKLPVIADIDMSHTEPRITFPVGGTAKISASGSKATIEIIEH